MHLQRIRKCLDTPFRLIRVKITPSFKILYFFIFTVNIIHDAQNEQKLLKRHMLSIFFIFNQYYIDVSPFFRFRVVIFYVHVGKSADDVNIDI